MSLVVGLLRKRLLEQGYLHIDETPVQVLDEAGRKNTIDAYKGYEKVSGITRCYCWTHLRRYFVDALANDTESRETTIPAQTISYISKVFEVEKKLEVLSPQSRKEQRLIQEMPVLEALWS